ncbi:unnamed protein product [Durusdinium trenchii]|uniref:Kinesin motor domain-containing protein n=1 Tax=Durusdinium trenchii TaxID=1381693 RepID=A0ABP0PIK9_9DINO
MASMAYRGILQEVRAEHENDENIQPATPANIQDSKDRPTDDDRVRFGFKPKTPPPVTKGAVHDGSQKAAVSAGTPPPPPPPLPTGAKAFDVHTLLRRTIGDPDDVLAVLKLKPTAGKYDFKDKIADLQAMICPLKNALSDQRLKAKALVDALLSMESGINNQLQTSAQEVVMLRKAVSEANERLCFADKEITALRTEQKQLRCSTEEGKRHEELLGEKLSEMSSRTSRLEQDLEEARKIARSYSEDAAKYKRRCEEMGEKHKTQMEEAQEQLVEAHHKKEVTLRAEFEKAKEAKKQEHKQQLDELKEVLRMKESEMQANTDALRDYYKKIMHEKDALLRNKESEMKTTISDMEQTYQAAIEEREGTLEEQENRMKNCIETLQKKHEVTLRELMQRQQQKEDKMRSSMDNLKETHEALLQEAVAGHRQKEAEMSLSIDELKRAHQAELKEKEHKMKESIEVLRDTQEAALREMESVHKQKETELREFVESLQRTHKRVLDEKDAAQKQAVKMLEQQLSDKESEVRSRISNLEQNQQRAVDEIEKSFRLKEEAAERAASESAAFLRQQETSLREMVHSLQRQLDEKEANLRDTIQSMQLLQNASSEQLRLEQQRVQRLETEAEDLRNRSIANLQRADQSEAELVSTRHQMHDLQEREQQRIQRLETEKEQLAEKASERQAALQEELIRLKMLAKRFEEEAISLKASVDAKQAQCEKLSMERDALKVEFRSYKEHHGTSNQQQMEAITELKLTVDKLSKQVDFTKAELQIQQGNLTQRQGYIISLENQLAQAELTRRELHNVIQELKGNIRVFCRIRPQLENRDSLSLQVSENRIALDHMSESYTFGFDRVFDTTSTQEAIFDEVDGLVQSALDGYKVCIFAYGQTGSGKTFTMQGSEGARGLIPRCLSKILQCSEAMRAAGWEWTLKVSFLEVYNEVLRDLLDNDGSNLVHVIKHDDAYGTMVTNVTSVEVKQMDHINRLMERAGKARAVGATDMNATSSRSHSIFAMYLHGVNRELQCELQGALHLVDLAGSERLDKSGSTGDRLKETQNINKSLSSLADVFLAKAEGRSHIPFRNSKLTHLMEPCLNGQGKTLMVVNVGPEAMHAHETLCSLRFAAQVSQCTTGGKPKRCLRSAPPKSNTGSCRQAAASSRRGK